MSQVLYDVNESEEIARILFSPTMVQDGRVSRNAFFLEKLKSGKWEKELSVWRTLYRIPTRENVNFPPRNPDDELFGYATLTVGTVHTQDIMDCTARVKRKSKDEKYYHVGIYYKLANEPIIGECDDLSFMALTMSLANSSVLNKFPPIDNSSIKSEV